MSIVPFPYSVSAEREKEICRAIVYYRGSLSRCTSYIEFFFAEDAVMFRLRFGL